MNATQREPIAAGEGEREALDRLEAVIRESLSSQEVSAPRLVDPSGEGVELPPSVVHALRQLVYYLSNDQAVAVIPITEELTTQEAADILNVSRPYVVKLLEEGKIPFTRVGTHRRISLANLIDYKQQFDTERRLALDELTQLSQEMGLYDS